MSNERKRARRGRGEASVYQRESDGRWVGSLSLGYDGAGKRRRKVVYGETKGEVAEELRKLQFNHDAGRLVETDELTTGEYLSRWLAVAETKTRPATFARYKQLAEQYLVPALGATKLAKLLPLHVERLRKLVKDRPDGAKISATANTEGPRDRARYRLATRSPVEAHPVESRGRCERPDQRSGNVLHDTGAWRQFSIQLG